MLLMLHSAVLNQHLCLQCVLVCCQVFITVLRGLNDCMDKAVFSLLASLVHHLAVLFWMLLVWRSHWSICRPISCPWNIIHIMQCINIIMNSIKAGFDSQCEYAAAKWTNATQSDLLTRAAGLCLSLSHVIPASLCHLKMIYPQTDVLSLTVCSIFCPLKGYEWNAKPQQRCPRPVIVCATVIFWLRDGKCWESRALNLWERLGFAPVGDTASVQSC